MGQLLRGEKKALALHKIVPVTVKDRKYITVKTVSK